MKKHNMEIQLPEYVLEDLGNYPEIFNETLSEYITRAIETQMVIDSVVMERTILPTEELHEYQVFDYQVGKILRVLKDKGFRYEVDKGNSEMQTIKVHMNPTDFMYVESIVDNHALDIKVPGRVEEMSDSMQAQLHTMYGLGGLQDSKNNS